jgi:hypothetical protein
MDNVCMILSVCHKATRRVEWRAVRMAYILPYRMGGFSSWLFGLVGQGLVRNSGCVFDKTKEIHRAAV